MITPGNRLSVTRFNDFAFDIGRLIPAVRPNRTSIRDLATIDLLTASPALVQELRSTPTKFQWEGHNRITLSILGFIAPMIGFATLLLGAFSRFGVWRQILGAICLLIALKLVDNSASSMARSIEGGWPLQYVAIAAGFVLCWALLKYAGRNRRVPALQLKGAET